MESEEIVDPTEVNKNPQLIKDAQDEIGKLDVLVCGECHDVFHFVEQFQEHRSQSKCTGLSSVRDHYKHEPKAQVWAFMLWKNSQFQKKELGENLSSWMIYQRWCKLDAHEKEAWCAAGKSIQSFTKISTAKVQEVKSTQAKTLNLVTVPSIPAKKIEGDPFEEGEIQLSQLTDNERFAIKAQVINKEVDPLGDLGETESELDTEEEIEKELGMVDSDKEKIDDDNFEPVKLNSEVMIVPSTKKPTAKRVIRIVDTETSEDNVVEKIIAKRFNPRKKCFEYFLKWENCNESENTWEPAAHLTGCKILLQEFEQEQQKIKAQKKLLAVQVPKKEKQETNVSVELTTRGRPQRTSKQKALNQVKAWCGDISDADEVTGKRKSISDDDDSSDSFEKKIKLEEDTESSEDEKPPITLRRIPKLNSSNGVAKRPLPENLLVPDAQGIVRINQKQLPELSSGVYIMSKTEGIIKLNSDETKIVTSGGTVKFSPKIGQTRIKVVRKEDGTTSNIIKLMPGTSKVVNPAYRLKTSADSKSTTGRICPKIITQRKPMAVPIKKTEHNRQYVRMDEDSDGIEDWEFPTDLPPPEPDSPPGEFTLDPLTGKLVGQEEAVPQNGEENQESVNLDNIVQLAAADLTDEDLSLTTEKKNENKELPAIPNSAEPLSTVISSPILGNALLKPSDSTSALPKKLLTTPNIQKANRPPPMINRTTIKPGQSSIRNPHLNRQRFINPKVSSGPVLNRTSNVTTYGKKTGNLTKKIGSTTIYKTTISPPTTSVSATSPKSIISMPSLVEDEATINPTLTQVNSSALQPESTEELGLALTETDTPLLITGEDGTIYQVAGQNEEGQTILISEGPDGQQQCVIVTGESSSEETEVLGSTLGEVSTEVEQPLMINTEADAVSEDTQVVAQIVKAEPPSPGGTRKVVLMLPDGNLMMTEVTAEQYAAL